MQTVVFNCLQLCLLLVIFRTGQSAYDGGKIVKVGDSNEAQDSADATIPKTRESGEADALTGSNEPQDSADPGDTGPGEESSAHEAVPSSAGEAGNTVMPSNEADEGSGKKPVPNNSDEATNTAKPSNQGDDDSLQNTVPNNSDEAANTVMPSNEAPEQNPNDDASQPADSKAQEEGQSTTEITHDNSDIQDKSSVSADQSENIKNLPSQSAEDVQSTSPGGKDVRPIASFKLTPAEIEKFKIWPEAKVPYYIDLLSYDKVLRDKIHEHLKDLQRRTYIQFDYIKEPPKDEDTRWVFFVNRRGQLDCQDYSTKSFSNKGVQKVIVGYDCLNHKGHLAAITLALLGIPPQHNAPNRDTYITVKKEHILPDKKGLFKRLSDGEWLFHDLVYDYNSASHYPSHKYSIDGSQTITINIDEENNQKQSRKSKNRRHSGVGVETGDNHLVGLSHEHSEPTDYSVQDIDKIALLYNQIIAKRPDFKNEDCKALYRPDPYVIPKIKLKRKVLPERRKPEKYLRAALKLRGKKTLDLHGETLSSLGD